MIAAIADTHAIIWYLSDDPRLSQNAAAAFDRARSQGEDIGVSTISLVEMDYLIEKKKIPVGVYQQLLQELADSTSLFKALDLGREVAAAVNNIPRASIPDMPDRIIAATALHLSVPLISRDTKVQISSIKTIW